ncbi:MAG TPA: tRNA pseudouridine(13) synthase TruD [Planctomycetes bacterium]|nr:tRNA pseudouridine(13) synthase TruD [Fuerstiella sp.]HIK90942.1 tRNA pseudouridine(13) synthase TruD [Planctomycetota bacterium]
MDDTLLQEIVSPPRANLPVLPAAILRWQPEDFQVEEIPTYLPDGNGQHLFLWIQKRNVSASDLISRLAKDLKVSARDIGVAGQKDRRAVTRQFVSVPCSCAADIGNLTNSAIQILSISAHGNKLRTGHLSGNRFTIVLRGRDGATFCQAEAEAVLDRLQLLETNGFPNYFGPQRFGHDGSSIRDGIELLTTGKPPGSWKRQQRRFLSKLSASAVQSAVFNLCLAQRIGQQTCSTVAFGDVACRRGGIKPFAYGPDSDTVAADLSPMGPMPGGKMVKTSGAVQTVEQQVMARLELSDDDFSRNSKLTPGTRRKYVEFPRNVSADLQSDGSLQLKFDLTAGTFATVLLAEICDVLI